MKKLFSLFIPVLLVSSAVSVSAQFLGQNNVMKAGGNFSQYLSKTMMKKIDANATKEGTVNAFNNTENTKGTRFLFDTWVNGDSVINTQGNYINTVTFLFNLDKVTGNLLVTQDKINIMAAAPTGINSFILQDNRNQYFFEYVNEIDSTKFFLALIKNDAHYSLYKQFKAKFAEANFRSDGVIQTGNDYNEYKDESQYYLVEKGSAKLISFKPKAIKALLEKDKEKTDTYFRQHKDDNIDERFLINLISERNYYGE